MILNRLGVRGRLNLLLLLPLIAFLLVAAPFVAGQIDNARSAGRTAETAGQARLLGALVWELQRELLVTTAYVASPTTDASDMLRQQRVVADNVDRVRSSLGPDTSDELTSALTRLGSLDELRQNAVLRAVSLDSLARTYHAVTEAVIDALGLVPEKSSDAEGARSLIALEALLRANEQSALQGTALIVAAVSPTAGQNLLDGSTAEAQIFTQRFVQQADAGQAALVVLVDQGAAARKIDTLTQKVPGTTDPIVTEAFVADALASVESQASLRRLVQDRVTTQIAEAAAARADAAVALAAGVGIGAAALLGLVVLLTVIISRSIADPLRQLTSSATTVADLAHTELVRVADTEDAEEQIPRLVEIDVASGGEVGELAAAFNRVQSTAAALLDRQATNRRNVSLMFASVARRTQNLVHRQLTVVDELERNEQDPDLLAGLYRVDHLSTRLRRSADKLLVVAGSRDQATITGPIELATAMRSALAEIEDYKRVRIGTISDVTMASPVGSDLVLVFAELIENATIFSPPESFVEFSARTQNDGSCLVAIVDHGVGMTPEQVAEENRRLVERERLDVAPTGVLGLFVVGRLARRHSLTVELAATPGGGITALVTIPPTLILGRVVQPAPPAAAVPTPSPRLPSLPPIPHITIPPARSADDGFVWFELPELTPAPAPAPALPPTPTPQPAKPVAMPVPRQDAAPTATIQTDPTRPGLHRRVPGAQLPSTAGVAPQSPQADRPEHDAVAARSAMDNYQAAVGEAADQHTAQASTVQASARATAQPPAVSRMSSPPPPRDRSTQLPGSDAAVGERHSGLSRRVPGANLAPGLRPDTPSGHPVRGDIARDADAERAAFDGFAAGLARADASMDSAAPSEHGDPS